jgi:two-component sensor histidine kinase
MAMNLRQQVFARWRAVLLPAVLVFALLAAAATWTALAFRAAQLEESRARFEQLQALPLTLPQMGPEDFINFHWQWVLAGGLTISLLISALVFQSLGARVREHEQTQQHLRALEKLADILMAIGSRIDAPREVLDDLARTAGDLLGMETSGVALLDPATNELKVLAYAGRVPPQPRKVFAMADLPLCRRVMESRRVMFIENVGVPSPAAQPQELNQSIARYFGINSVILIPLYVGMRALGMMFVGDSQPRTFNDSQRRLARVLGGKAAVILSNSDLYKRMGDAMRSQQRLFEQREAIFAVNAAVYQASSFQESLQIIAELAPGVLDVDLCVVTLTTDDEERAMIAAVTRPHGDELVGKLFYSTGTNGSVIRASRRMMVVEDARTHPGSHPVLREQLDVGSAAYLPLLRTGGEFMGSLVLIRHAPGPFRPEQLNLAEMFASRAAAAIENARLLDQTRRDAEAKTMLLRELNHRVKNNLASIITLLSLDEPEMSPLARQWLARAIDRIRTMARTHDLFSGGIDRVRLVELVEQIIPSLSVVKPPGVTIRSELGDASLMLRTDRAVSLAMVLHELCSNAIIHGTGASGTVTIHAELRRAEKPFGKFAGWLVLQVIDQGKVTAGARRERALAVVTTPSPGTPGDGWGGGFDAGEGVQNQPIVERVGSGGLGLMLVNGLVTRELGGSFARMRGRDRGTIARVEIPVSAEEAGGSLAAGK